MGKTIKIYLILLIFSSGVYGETTPIATSIESSAVVSPTQTVNPESTATPIPYNLHQAATWGNLEKIQKCLALGVDINGYDFQQTTALHRAAAKGKVENIKYLVEHGANPEILDGSLRTPIMWAAMLGKTDAFRYFLSLNVKLDLVDHVGWDIYDLSKQMLPSKNSRNQKIILKMLADIGITEETKPAIKALTPKDTSTPAKPSQ